LSTGPIACDRLSALRIATAVLRLKNPSSAANAVLTCQTSLHFSLANHSVTVDRTATQVTLAAGVSKEIHDLRAKAMIGQLAHLVH